MLIFVVTVVTTGVFAIQVPPVIRDYDNLFAYKPLSEAQWSEYLSVNADQIYEGSTDTEFLNACYRGGWRRCLFNFDHGYSEWDYYWLKENKPYEMSGNMPDTDRVAGQLGWRHCTDRLRTALRSEKPSSIQNQIAKFSPRWIAFAAVVFVGITMLVSLAILTHLRTQAG